jgi:hypothetical protein
MGRNMHLIGLVVYTDAIGSIRNRTPLGEVEFPAGLTVRWTWGPRAGSVETSLTIQGASPWDCSPAGGLCRNEPNDPGGKPASPWDCSPAGGLCRNEPNDPGGKPLGFARPRARADVQVAEQNERAANASIDLRLE